MAFPQAVKEEALIRSRRTCCICRDFSGRAIEVHHIVQEAKGGPNTLENAIVLCLRCHSEVGHYNPGHPIGNKYSIPELKQHRDEWWAWCKENPGAPLPKSPIIISPYKVALGPKAWKTRSIIAIHNKSDDFWYQIIIRMTVEPGTVAMQDVHLKPSTIEDVHKIDEDSGFALYSQLFRIDGINAAGEQIAYLWLSGLDPRETVKLVLSNRSRNILRTPQQSQLSFLVNSFSQEPGNILTQSNGAIGIQFQAPETFSMKGVHLLLEKTKRTSF